MKVVLDTNVLVAAFATQGLCHAVFELCIDQHQLILSRGILQEFRDALEKKLKVPPGAAGVTVNYLRDHAVVHPLKEPYPRVSRDPSDDHVLALAQKAGADYLVTGDEDLLVLDPHGTARIVSPRGFWEMLRKTADSPR